MQLPAEVGAVLARQAIEVPSWAYGNSGTRFKVFAQAGVPRDPFEKIADAAQVHALTGLAPTVALHIPWDEVDDFAKLRATAVVTLRCRRLSDMGAVAGSMGRVADQAS